MPRHGKPVFRLQIVAMQLFVVIHFRIFSSISLLATSLIETPMFRSYSQHTIVLKFSAIFSLSLSLHVFKLLAHLRSVYKDFSLVKIENIQGIIHPHSAIFLTYLKDPSQDAAAPCGRIVSCAETRICNIAFCSRPEQTSSFSASGEY